MSTATLHGIRRGKSKNKGSVLSQSLSMWTKQSSSVQKVRRSKKDLAVGNGRVAGQPVTTQYRGMSAPDGPPRKPPEADPPTFPKVADDRSVGEVVVPAALAITLEELLRCDGGGRGAAEHGGESTATPMLQQNCSPCALESYPRRTRLAPQPSKSCRTSVPHLPKSSPGSRDSAHFRLPLAVGHFFADFSQFRQNTGRLRATLAKLG